jgi:Cu(I)/Ag(I) efflux system membrane fusion protein
MHPRISVGLLLLSIAGTIPAAGCRPSSPGPAASAPAAADYYCPMHPSYRSDRPGECPICHMELVLSEGPGESAGAGLVAGRATAEIPPHLQARIGLATAEVVRAPFVRTIRAAARVELDERGLSLVSLRYGGWIEELFVRATGEPVRAGDPLFSVYSPELYEAQRSYLFARKSMAPDDEAVASLRERLSLWSMTEEQIAALETRGEPETRTLVLAKAGGVVTRREAALGLRFEAGATLFEISDLSTVWVVADVYQDELPLVRVGAVASIELGSAFGPPLEGRISFLYPTLEESTRTARVRIEVQNPDGSIRPGLYATARIACDLGEQTLVDVDAVIDTGTRRIAFVESAAGVFEPREIELGARDGGRAVVLAGLEPGEKVVARATFLVDSESRLKAALSVHAAHRGPH